MNRSLSVLTVVTISETEKIPKLRTYLTQFLKFEYYIVLLGVLNKENYTCMACTTCVIHITYAASYLLHSHSGNIILTHCVLCLCSRGSI